MSSLGRMAAGSAWGRGVRKGQERGETSIRMARPICRPGWEEAQRGLRIASIDRARLRMRSKSRQVIDFGRRRPNLMTPLVGHVDGQVRSANPGTARAA